jgi:hypothetical protein
MEQSPSGEANSLSASQKNYSSFMEPERSLPYSQGPATSPYAEPDKSNLYLPTLFP